MKLHHHRLGSGPRVLLAFHGIGQDGLSCFRSFGEKLGRHYTIYAFDLYFHGKHTGSPATTIAKSDFAALIDDFLTENHIQNFDVAGFSMGGRFALALLEALPERIQNAFLIAPDGISEHPLYTLASRFLPARKLFQWCMQHPKALFYVAGLLKNSGLVHPGLHHFTRAVLETPEKRSRVYNSWVSFRQLRFNVPALYQRAVQHHIQIYLFTGEFDTLVQAGHVRKLARLLPPDRIISLKSGHTQLVDRAGSWICTLFK